MKIAEELSKIDLIDEINNLKIKVDGHRPFDRDVQNRIFQKFRLDWNYHSNAIEGNPLSYGETVAFIMHGITAKGKKLKDHLDIKGHNEAISFLLDWIKGERSFDQADIRKLHKMILVEPYVVNAIIPEGLPTKKKIKIGEYKSSPNHVRTITGEMHYYTTPEDTPIKMSELIKWYNQASQNKEIHPLVLATLFHHEFVAIHPFDDGNGRLARILMNFILMRNQLPPVIVKQNDRDNYYAILSQADAGEYLPLVQYFGELLKYSLTIQLKGIKGEDIYEPTDIDKEIALFKTNLEKEEQLRSEKSKDVITTLFNGSIFPLNNRIQSKARKLDDLFLSKIEKLELIYGNNKGLYLDINTDGVRMKNIVLKHIAKEESLSRSCRYRFTWNGFKKNASPFDSYFELEIDFQKYKYNFTIKNERNFLSKPYHKELTQIEQNAIVENLLKKVMEDIKNRMN